MTNTSFFRFGALLLAIAVAAGAFGAHVLRGVVSPERLLVWEKAVLYQLIHGVALFALGLSALNNIYVARAGGLLAIGTVIFSGSLYLLVLTDTPWLGAITPIGGTLMIIGWVMITLMGSRTGSRT